VTAELRSIQIRVSLLAGIVNIDCTVRSIVKIWCAPIAPTRLVIVRRERVNWDATFTIYKTLLVAMRVRRLPYCSDDMQIVAHHKANTA
jgi:hypothetical protein